MPTDPVHGPYTTAPGGNRTRYYYYDHTGREIDPPTEAASIVLPIPSLRDWFAGQALVGMGTWSPAPYNFSKEARMLINAQYAYEIADAMLKARERHERHEIEGRKDE